jgi:hypothetical protein
LILFDFAGYLAEITRASLSERPMRAVLHWKVPQASGLHVTANFVCISLQTSTFCDSIPFALIPFLK